MKIKFNDLKKQWEEIKKDFNIKFENFMNSSTYIGGEIVEKFEDSFSIWSGRKYSIGVSNGTDGLRLAVQAFQFYDGNTDVIIPANAYISNALSVKCQIKGKFNISLIDHDDYFQMDLNLLEKHLSENRKKYKNCIIMPVHLYGHPTNMKKVFEISKSYNCKIIEDASQAHGAVTNGEMVGKYADMTVYSLYPGKNLGAVGDAGIITTDNEIYNSRLKSLRNYGSPKKYEYIDIGWNNRMDPIQAIFLSEKLKKIDEWNNQRNAIAKKYNFLLKNNIEIPKVDNHVNLHSYHIYCISVENREKFQNFLNNKNIPTFIHYPKSISQLNPFQYLNKYKTPKTFKTCNKIISLPIHPYLSDCEIEYITDNINYFFK